MLTVEMPVNAVLDKLRQRIYSLEGRQNQFSRTIPIADVVDQWLPHGGLSAGCIHEIKGTTAIFCRESGATLKDRGSILDAARPILGSSLPDCACLPGR